jgi:hypothetical protein
MKTLLTAVMIAAFMAISQNTRADVLQLKNGSTLVGKYAGGNAASVRFETSLGAQEVETAQIASLTFGNSPTAQPAAPATAPTGAAPGSAATIPAGTILTVRTSDPISSKDKAGTKFGAKLDADLTVGNVVVAKAGTVVYGAVQASTQAGRARGQSTLDLRLTQLAVNGKQVPLTTSGYQDAGKRSGAKAAKGAAAGAAIGAVAGDAGKGAAIGAASGAAVKGETISVAPGTLLDFTLTQPVTIGQ